VDRHDRAAQGFSIVEVAGERRQTLLLMAALLCFSMWFYVDRVWAPPVYLYYSDLFPRWYGARELLLRGRDPYGPEVTREIQSWGRAHVISEAELHDEPRFAYPLYIVFLLTPTVRYSFPAVEALFRWILPITVLVTVPLWLSALRWRCDRLTVGLLTLLSFGSFTTLQDVYLQQPVLLAALFLAASCAALSKGLLPLAGVLLALATIKPPVSWLAVVWLLVWALWDWGSRKNLVWGFVLAMALLVGASEHLLPGWIPEFVSGLAAYSRYTRGSWMLGNLVTQPGALVVCVAILILFARMIWRIPREPAGSAAFNFGLSFALVVTVVVTPIPYTTGQVMLLPAIFVLVKEFKRVWAGGRYSRLIYVGVWALIGWQWVGSLIFMAAATVVSSNVLRKFWIVPVGTVLFIPLAMLLLYFLLAGQRLFDARPTGAAVSNGG
jgi:hypothetical protein